MLHAVYQMGFSMLKVPCGISGKVRVVRENSLTGEITGEFNFDNIWTDYGLSAISTYCTTAVTWPSRLHWGSGAHSTPHNGVTELKAWVGSGSVSFSGSSNLGVVYDTEVCTVTRTASSTQAARGVSWQLKELGLSYISSNRDMLTYALLPAPVNVSDIEIITIYYTLQVKYPMALPPMPVVVSGLPPTTATFALRPDKGNFANSSIGSCYSSTKLNGYTTYDFAGPVDSRTDGNTNFWRITDMNRETGFFGTSGSGASHIWTIDPPITKDDTQVLELEVFWQFSNVTPTEV